MNLENLHSFSVSVARHLRGLIVISHNVEHPPRPELPLELYEYEACPFCRKVRETMTELDLVYISRTSARGAEAKREAVVSRGGKAQFPYLVDPNTGAAMYESEEIIDYLWKTYGPGRNPLERLTSPLDFVGSAIGSALRPRGRRVAQPLTGRAQPDALPILYQFENSPYCRKVREALAELNLDYEVRNVGKRSTRRPELVARGGKMMVPYLIDPNTDTALYESDDIVRYLRETYAGA